MRQPAGRSEDNHDGDGQPRRPSCRSHRGRNLQPPLLLRTRGRDLYPREKTAREWEAYPGFAEAHLRELRAILDETDPGYAA